MGGDALRAPCLELAGRIAAKTGCGILTEGANTRLERGAGRVQVERIPYVVDKALGVMREAGNLVLVGAREPVAFFAYPDKPSLLMAEGARSTKLAGVEDDMQAALEALAIELGAMAHGAGACRRAAPARDADRRDHAGGDRLRSSARCCPRTPSSWTRASPPAASSSPRRQARRRTTGSTTAAARSATARPSPIGAAIACPDRKVVALEGDGSAMYTLQSLWTMAREGPGRHRGDFRQRHLQYPARRADQRRRAQSRARAPSTCCRSDARISTGSRSPAAWAWRRARAKTCEQLSRR